MKLNKTQFYLIFTTLLLSVSCTNENKDKLATSSNDDTYETSYGNRNGTIVDNLYQDLVEENEALASLEKELNTLHQQLADSSRDYTQYNEYNNEYYAAALTLNNGITDSLLKNSIELLIKKSQNQYDEKNASLDLSIAQLNSKYRKLQDEYLALKILLTLDIIEKKQDQKRPLVKNFTSLTIRFDKCLKQVDSLIETK